MFSKITPWIIASRIKTLPAAVWPVFVGTALAFNQKEQINILIFFSILFASILIQLGTNFSNDLSDFVKGTDTDDRLSPKRAAQSGLLSVNNLKVGVLISFFLSILIGIYLVTIGGYVIVLIGLLSIISGILYTEGTYTLGYNGLGDLFVFIFFGIIAVMGTFYLHTLNISFGSFICGCIIGSISTAIIVVNNIRDAKTDIKTGKKTLAVKFGIHFSQIEFSILVTLPFILIIFLFYEINDLGIFLTFFSLPISINLIKRIFLDKGSALNEVLAKTARFLVAFSFLLFLGLIL